MLDPTTPVTPGWRLVGRILADGEPISLDGLDPWKHDWRSVDVPPIVVAHPQYPNQRHDMAVYEIARDRAVRFAAGEFSNGAWGFYLTE
jgi:hypothetical protein